MEKRIKNKGKLLYTPRSLLCSLLVYNFVRWRYTATEYGDVMMLFCFSGFTVRHVVEFGHSAFKHQNNEVRKVGERLLLALYAHYPTTVRKVLPQTDDIARKNVLYRNLFEQFEVLDEKVS